MYAPDAPQPVTEDTPLLDFAEPAYGETARAVHSLEQQITADPAFIGIVCASVVTSRFGAMAANRLPVSVLKKAFGAFLCCVAVMMFFK